MKIICRTPVRIDLGIGGDTDYFVNEIGWGNVVNVTLSSHFYEVELNEETKSKVEIVDYFDYSHNMNRAYKLDDSFSETELLKAIIKHLKFKGRNCFISKTNVPMHAGLGGSSSLAVAIIAAILHHQRQNAEPEKVARLAYHIERNILGIGGGYQDQYAAAYGGGFNYMEFRPKGAVKVTPLKISEKIIQELEKRMVIYYIKERKFAGGKIHESQEEEMKKNRDKIKRVLTEKRKNAFAIKVALEKGKLETFGELLKKEWEIQKNLSEKITNESIEKFMNLALNNGATGGKLCGAGSGGCAVFYVPKEKLNMFKEAMRKTGELELNFRFQRKHEPGIKINVIKEEKKANRQ